jgi:hypothetical protein
MMATYRETVDSVRSPEDTFRFLADLTNFAVWDPGVLAAEQVAGDGPGPGARFDVSVKAWPRPLTLTYETVEFDAPSTVRVVARSSRLVSDDTITVVPTDDGCRVTYEANLRLEGWLGPLDPVVGLLFDRIAGRAGDGLRDELAHS